MTPTQAVEIRIEFFCPAKYPADLGLAAEIQSALAPLLSGGFLLHPRKQRYRCTLTTSSRDLSLMDQQEKSESLVGNLMSKVEACVVEYVRLTFIPLPVLKRPRKPRPNPLPPCDCEELFCEHIPPIPWDEHLANCKREDAADRKRRSRQQLRDRYC
jgi:hypothetical protein